MGNTQFAFLAKSSVPERASWQAQIDRCGFDFQLDPELRPFEDSGSVPCKLHGRDSGFEIYYEESEELRASFPGIAADQDYCIWFRWGGDMSECACVMIATYVLARSFGATVYYEGQPPYSNLEVFLSDTQAVIREANEDA